MIYKHLDRGACPCSSLETETKEGISKTEYTLTEHDEGTVFTVEVSLIPSNWYYKLMNNMFKWSFKYVYDDQFNNFIEYVYNHEYKIDEDQSKTSH
ncbi:hypothetical protein ACFSTA_20120 [Ornithinibacillus salinisoli]|uniref:KTSC domain-containing protein n=1 Tax=Ornithinibacillus salinisoli TaxID=1848459 RepID=A0ABW4W4B1_9BACI